MTTVAWNGEKLCTDKAGHCGHRRMAGSFQKLKRVGNTVYAFTGMWPYFQPMVDWHQAGADPEKLPSKFRDDENGTLVVFKDGRCFVYGTKYPYADEHFAPAAWGSGEDFAIAILAVGGTPRQAIETASLLDVYTGGGVDEMDLSFQTAPQPGVNDGQEPKDDGGAAEAA